MKKIATIALCIISASLSAQIQVYKPYRTIGNVQVADSALFVGKLKIASFASPSLGGYADKVGQSFGLNTTNSRLSVRGVSAWLEYPTLTEVNSLIGAAGLVTPTSTTTFSNKTISGTDNTITNIPYSALTIANLNLNATLRWTSGTEYNGSTARQAGINLSNPNTWTSVQTFPSPVFTGIPAAPTPASNINTTQVVNGQWVNTYYVPITSLSSYELLSNKSTSTSLGASNTLYPTQNAVKSYVDGLGAGYVTIAGNETISGIKTFSAAGTIFSTNISVAYVSIGSNSVNARDAVTQNNAGLNYSGFTITKGGTGNSLNITAPTISTPRSQTLQDADGVVALTSDLPIAGSYSGVGAATTTFTVTIGATQANTTYKVNATPTNLLSAALFYITNKTTTSFDVVYLAGLTGTVEFDWSVFK